MATIDEEGLTTKEQRDEYARDGAIVLRNVIPDYWIQRMRGAIDRFHAEYQIGLWMSRMDEDFDAFSRSREVAQIAAEMMGVDEVRFFYDQLFVRPAQTAQRTPVHQDLPYWPIEGKDVISIWVPFDEVRSDNSVVQYLKGSHRWGRMFEPAPFSERHRVPDAGYSGLEVIEDPDALVEESEILCWEVRPGDVIVHDPLILHFANPNTSQASLRRADALRYVGPDSRFIDRPAHFMRRKDAPAHWPRHEIVTGAPISGDDYPQVWPPRIRTTR